MSVNQKHLGEPTLNTLSLVVLRRFGRKSQVAGGSIVFTIIAIASVWVNDFSAMLAARFILGLSYSTLLKTSYILGESNTEITGYSISMIFCDSLSA